MNHFKFLSVLVFSFFIASCSSTQQAYLNNIKLYFSTNKANTLTEEQITTAPFDIAYVTNGERAISTVGLAFIEDGAFKWLSADNAMLVFSNGRLVKTAGLNEDLLGIHYTKIDPLNAPRTIEPDHSWQWSADTDTSRVFSEMTSRFAIKYGVELQTQAGRFDTFVIDETVLAINGLVGSASWVNQYWYESRTGKLLKSIQTPFIKGEVVEITFISQAFRIAQNGEK